MTTPQQHHRNLRTADANSRKTLETSNTDCNHDWNKLRRDIGGFKCTICNATEGVRHPEKLV